MNVRRDEGIRRRAAPRLMKRALGGRAETPLAAPDGAAPGDLIRLIEVEDAITRMLAQVRAEAERVLEEARVAERSRARREEKEIREALDAATARIDAECRREIGRIVEGARREADRYDAIADERVATLASTVVARVVGRTPGERGTTGPEGAGT